MVLLNQFLIYLLVLVQVKHQTTKKNILEQKPGINGYTTRMLCITEETISNYVLAHKELWFGPWIALPVFMAFELL